MTTHYCQAHEFRVHMGQPVHSRKPKLLKFQQSLIKEEYKELMEAIDDLIEDPSNLQKAEHMLKELADLPYVCYQLAAATGMDLDKAIDRVHVSNMSKMVNGAPVKNKEGKVMKGPNYKLPVLTDLV